MSDGAAGGVVEYYSRAFREADRLTATALGRLEFARTVALLGRNLPAAPARVVDVGGGTGAYAAWLADGGYEVQLYDLVPSHVEAVQAALPHVPAAAADARSLPEPDGSADAVVLMGPLYHLLGPDDRHAALVETRRVVQPHGVLAAAAIGRYADVLWCGVDGRLDGATTGAVRRGLADGHHEALLGFTDVHLHTVEQLTREVTAAGWAAVRVFGVEGPTWPAVRQLPADADLAHHVGAADLLDAHPETAAVSSHLLAVATAG